jgi:Ca2+-binding RTX toxin-like protein
MTGTLLPLRQRRSVLLLTAFLCLLVLGLAPQIASAAGPGFFSPTGSMSIPRLRAAAAPLPDGRVLVAGGTNSGGDVLRSAEVFDPATNAFTSGTFRIGSMSVPRAGAAAAPLPDGRVLVVGGRDASGHPLASAEVFDPGIDSFSAPFGPMSVPRAGAVAAPLPDGRVLVAGGSAADFVTHLSAEVFNAATGTFSSAGIGSMAFPRVGAAAAPLADGRVLVAGGGYHEESSLYPCDLSSAEVFNPATGSFSSAGSMTHPRSGAAAAPLPDGVLVAGGSFEPQRRGCTLGGNSPPAGSPTTPWDPGSSAEVFDPATNSFSSAGIGSMSVPRIGPAAAPLPGGRVLVAGGYSSPGDLSSAEIFAAGSAPPSAICRGMQATIVGTDGADRITGTPGADVIAALGGKDRLSGLAGKDVICGAKGDDTLKGGAGNDQLSGQKGNDKLYGQKGNDKLSGKAGRDTLKGGPGKDMLKGGAGQDKQVQ